jgi:hypothetical protein
MSVWDLTQHSYEEVREAVIDILLGRVNVGNMPRHFTDLIDKVTFIFGKRSTPAGLTFDPANPPRIHPYDAEFVREVFWDLFRQGLITLGIDSSQNAGWPWFRLSRFGANTLQTKSPYRFHDTTSFLALVKAEVPDISDDANTYLDEAVAAFYADCLLASSVMLGVAAEVEFLRLLEVAYANTTHGAAFSAIQSKQKISHKIKKFQEVIKPLLPSLPWNATEGLESYLDAIQSVLRIARNDAGHPSGAKYPEREWVYVSLHLFIPFARQLARLRAALA